MGLLKVLYFGLVPQKGNSTEACEYLQDVKACDDINVDGGRVGTGLFTGEQMKVGVTL